MVEAIVTLLGTGLLGVFGWAVQVGNRVTILETQRDALETYLESKFEEVHRRLDDIDESVRGIR